MLQKSHLILEGMPIVPFPIEDKSQMLVGASGFFVHCKRGIRWSLNFKVVKDGNKPQLTW